MPNGYSEVMRIFTKIKKPPFEKLRSQGHLSVTFVDDSYLQGKSLQNIRDTGKLLEALRFTIHKGKYVLEPTQSIEFLGFVIVLVKMTASLNPEKTNAILKKKSNILKPILKLIGSLTSVFPAVPLGKLHYSYLEKIKSNAFRLNRGNFNAKISKLDNLFHEEIK